MVQIKKLGLILVSIAGFSSCASSPNGELTIKKQFDVKPELETNPGTTSETRYGLPIYFYVQKYPTIVKNDILLKQDILVQIGERGVDTDKLLDRYSQENYSK